MAPKAPSKPRKSKAAPPAPKAPRYRRPPEAPKPNAMRAHRYPSLLWQRQWLAALKQLFPRGVTQEVVDELWPAAVQQWRYNLSAPAAALNICQGREGLFAAEIRQRHYAAPLEVERGPRGSALGPPSGLPSGGPAVPCEGPECSLGLMGGACGLPAQLLTPSAQGAPTRHLSRYCLIEADKVITSHDPLHGFRPRPEYPAGVQERRYDKDRNEQYKVIEIAQTLRPELIFSLTADGAGGLPVVNEQGLALGGNGRAMAIQLAYKDGGDEIKKYLLEHAREFGFSPGEVHALKKPLVVRVIKTGQDRTDLARLVRVLNLSFTGGIDARGLAVAQARTLDQAALDELAAHLDDNTTLPEFLESNRSRNFIAALRKSQIINDRNVNELLNADGLLNRAGRQRIENLLVGALLSDADLLDAIGEQLYNTIARAAPWFLSAAAINPAFDIRAALTAAAHDRVAMRRYGYRSVDQYLAQGTLLNQRAAVVAVPLGEPLLRVLLELEGSPLRFARFAREYANLARRTPQGQGLLLASEELSPRDALLQAGKRQGIDFP